MINVSLKTKAKEVDGNYVLDGITIGRVTDLKPNEWFGKVMLSNVGEEFAEYGLLDPMAIVEGDDGVTYKDPKGGSDGSRGTLLEPDGTPVVNVTSYDEDEHEDFIKDLFGESKAKEYDFNYEPTDSDILDKLFREYSETVSKSNPPSQANAIKYLVDHGIQQNEAEVTIYQYWNAYDWKMIVEGPSMFDQVDYIDGSDVPTSGFYESKAKGEWSSIDKSQDQLDKEMDERLERRGFKESKAREFNIGTTMICPVCNKEIETGNQDSFYHNSNFYDPNSVPFSGGMQDHMEREHSTADFGVDPHPNPNIDEWYGNNLHTAFKNSFPEYSQDDAIMMNNADRGSTLDSSGNRMPDEYIYVESKATEVSAEEEEVANDLWIALAEGGLLGDFIHGGIFKFEITYPSWVTDITDTTSISWDELSATDKQNVVNHFGGVEGMKEKLCDEGWDNYCEPEEYADESKANEEEFIPTLDQKLLPDSWHICKKCDGRGYIVIPYDREITCPECNGAGKVATESKANEYHEFMSDYFERVDHSLSQRGSKYELAGMFSLEMKCKMCGEGINLGGLTHNVGDTNTLLSHLRLEHDAEYDESVKKLFGWGVESKANEYHPNTKLYWDEQDTGSIMSEEEWGDKFTDKLKYVGLAKDNGYDFPNIEDEGWKKYTESKANEEYSDPECSICGKVMHNSYEQGEDEHLMRSAIKYHYQKSHQTYFEATDKDVVEEEMKKQLVKTGITFPTSTPQSWESKANENSNWKAFTNAQRQEIIDLADVSVSADTEWEDISIPDQEDLSIHLVSQGALASADFTGFADEYVNKIKLDGLNVKNHVRETLRDKIHNWKKMDRDVRKEDSEYAGIDQDVIDTIVDMSLDKIRKEFPEEHKKLDQIGVWGFGESRAKEKLPSECPHCGAFYENYDSFKDHVEQHEREGTDDFSNYMKYGGESKANEDGMYANFGTKPNDESWSVLTVASDLIFFSTRKELDDYVKDWDRKDYSIHPPKYGNDNPNAIESKANEYGTDDLYEWEHDYQKTGEPSQSDWLDDHGYDYAEPTYQQRMDARSLVDRNFTIVQKQTSVPEYGDNDWEYGSWNTFSEDYNMKCNLCGMIFNTSADKDGRAEQHLRDQHQIQAYGITHPQFKTRSSWGHGESKANESDWQDMEELLRDTDERLTNPDDYGLYGFSDSEIQRLKATRKKLQSILNDMNNWTFTGDWAGTSETLADLRATVGESKANENVASKMAYYYQNDAPKDWNDNQVSNEAEKILEET